MYSSLFLRRASLGFFAKTALVSAGLLLLNQDRRSRLRTDSHLPPWHGTKTYIWGNERYQARPDRKSQFSGSVPKLIETFRGAGNPNLIDIKFGQFHEASIDLNHRLFVSRRDGNSPSAGGKALTTSRQDVYEFDVPGKAVQASFTEGFLWVLNQEGEVYQYPIIGTYEGENIVDAIVVNVQRKVEGLPKIKQIATGEDHFVAVSADRGEVWTMGDDTMGQCGVGQKKRSTAPPFHEHRVMSPAVLPIIKNVTKVVCGSNHTLAVTKDGLLYGWGSNSNLQLSHEEEFAAPDHPLIAVYSPTRMDNLLNNNRVVDIAAGDQFSIIVSKNQENNETEVFGCGHNLHGELGAGIVRHINDIIKIESLSNYEVPQDNGVKPVDIDQISCGSNHCMALLNIGAVVVWGANEAGQLGSQNRAFCENPRVLRAFTSDKVLKVSCGYTSSAVIADDGERQINLPTTL